MKIWKEKTAFDFLVDDAWCVDERLSGVISDAGMVDEFNQLAEDMFPDGGSKTIRSCRRSGWNMKKKRKAINEEI